MSFCGCGSNSFSPLRGTNSKTKLVPAIFFYGFSTLSKGTGVTLTVVFFRFKYPKLYQTLKGTTDPSLLCRSPPGLVIVSHMNRRGRYAGGKSGSHLISSRVFFFTPHFFFHFKIILQQKFYYYKQVCFLIHVRRTTRQQKDSFQSSLRKKVLYKKSQCKCSFKNKRWSTN